MSEFGGGSEVGSSEVTESNESVESTSTIETGGEISDASMESIENDASSVKGFESGTETPDMEFDEDSYKDLSEMSDSTEEAFNSEPDLNYQEDVDFDDADSLDIDYDYSDNESDYMRDDFRDPDLEYAIEDEGANETGDGDAVESTASDEQDFSLEESEEQDQIDSEFEDETEPFNDEEMSEEISEEQNDGELLESPDDENVDTEDYKGAIDDLEQYEDFQDDIDDDAGDVAEEYDDLDTYSNDIDEQQVSLEDDKDFDNSDNYDIGDEELIQAADEGEASPEESGNVNEENSLEDLSVEGEEKYQEESEEQDQIDSEFEDETEPLNDEEALEEQPEEQNAGEPLESPDDGDFEDSDNVEVDEEELVEETNEGETDPEEPEDLNDDNSLEDLSVEGGEESREVGDLQDELSFSEDVEDDLYEEHDWRDDIENENAGDIEEVYDDSDLDKATEDNNTDDYDSEEKVDGLDSSEVETDDTNEGILESEESSISEDVSAQSDLDDYDESGIEIDKQNPDDEIDVDDGDLLSEDEEASVSESDTPSDEQEKGNPDPDESDLRGENEKKHSETGSNIDDNYSDKEDFQDGLSADEDLDTTEDADSSSPEQDNEIPEADSEDTTDSTDNPMDFPSPSGSDGPNGSSKPDGPYGKGESENRQPHTFKDWVNPNNYENGQYIGEGQDWGYKPYGEDTSELRDNIENSPETRMSAYMSERGYGPDDYAEYSQDPEWRGLNAEFENASDETNHSENSYRDEMNERGYVTISANNIQGVDSSGEHFWDHQGSSKEDFTEIASKLPDVQELLDNGATIEEIRENPDLKPTVDAYYDPDNMVVVEKTEDGFRFQDDGRHRVAAAQELGYDVPVKVIEVPSEQSTEETFEKFADNLDDEHLMESEDGYEFSDAVYEINQEDEGNYSELEEEIANSDNGDIAEDYSYDVDQDDSTNMQLDEKPEGEAKGAFFDNVSYRQGQNDFGAYGTCGPTSIANSLNRVTESSNYSENAVLHNAMDNNLCSRSSVPMAMGGTTTRDVVAIIDNVKDPESNIHTEVYDYDNSLGVDELADRLEGSGTVAIVGVDSATLWDQRGDVSSSGLFHRHEASSDHWITVDSPVRDENGKVTGFNIIDSGGGESFVDRDKFERMYKGDENHRVSDPTAILVSNKGEAVNTYDEPTGVERASNYKGNGTELPSDGRDSPKRETEKLVSFSDFDAKQKDIGRNEGLTIGEKVDAIKEAYNNVIDKRDINVPSDAKYIKRFDEEGRVEYEWPSKLGFREDTIQSITKDSPLPERWDRYGHMGGTNFASIPEKCPYTYTERAIPYVENSDAYHSGDFNNETYFDKIDAIRNGDIDGLNSILESEGIDEVDDKYFKGLQETYGDYMDDVKDAIGVEVDATYGLQGKAAEWKDMEGGANQFVTPFSGNVMSRLGICREDS